MGMIMKDGVPYGGVYPIDDVPTQGSDNTVKSGGVFNSLSNKVDKVAGKGLSTNDYDNTEKGKVTATQDMISDAYDSTHTYNVGDYCIFENTFYRCNTDNTRGPWDSSKWYAVTVAEDLGELREKSVKVVGIPISAGENAVYDIPAIVGYPHFILIGSNNPGVWSWCGIVTYSQFGFIVYEIHKGANISVEAVATGIKITNNDGVYYVMLTLRQF